MRKRVTRNLREKFANEYRNGLGTDIIARKYNFGKTAVRKHLLYTGIKFRPAPKDIISVLQHNKFVRLYKSGLSIKKIAIKCNSTFATVQRHLKKENIKMKLRGDPKEISKNAGKLTLEKSYILGVVGPGDGFIEIPKNYPYGGSYRICLEATDKDFIDYFAFCLKEVYGLTPKIKLLNPRSGDIKPHYKVILCSKSACDDILNYGVSFREKDWRIPEIIKNSSIKIKAKYLQGISDSQGCVTNFKISKSIYLCSMNKDGMREAMNLLKDIGITGSVYKIGIRIGRSDNIKQFAKKVNFNIERKKKRLNMIIESYKRKSFISDNFNYKYPSQEFMLPERLNKLGV